MLFAKKDANLTAEEFAVKYPELAKAIQAGGNEELKTENTKLKEQLKKRSDTERIQAFAKTLDLVDEGKACIEAGMSLEKTSVHLLETRTELEGNLIDSVIDTASEAAGVDPKKNESDDKPKTIQEAMHFIKERDNLKSLADAMAKVKVEFPELLENIHVEVGYTK